MRSGKPATVAVTTALLVGLNGPPALAAAGDLDATFGGDGKVTTNFTSGSDNASGVAIQAADGKLVVAGTANYRGADARFALARYDPDGSLDTTFSGDGRVTTNFTSRFDGAFSVAIQADGKIVAVGESGGTGAGDGARFALARYDADGTLDATFGGDGKVTTNVSRGADIIFGLAIQPADDKIVVTGRTAGSGGRIAVARYDPDGTLDATFGGDGKVATNLTRGEDRADELAIQPLDGKIVVAGAANYLSNRARFTVVRYEADGTLDATFDGEGKVMTDMTSTFDAAFGVAIQADGKIVVAGQAANRMGLARYDTGGSLDNTFGGDGKVTTNFTSELDYADDVAIQAGDGRIIAAGAIRFFGPDARFAMARYDTNGALDSTFGGDGRVTTDFSARSGGIFNIAIQPGDAKIVAVGSAGGSGGRFGVARYLP
jgi:uncharacterized delta-60 repeat protein